MSSQGQTFYDSSGNYIELAYSDLDSLAGSPLVYTIVSEVKSLGRNPEASPEIEFTHYASTEQELRLGLPRRGSWDATANFVPTSASQAAVIALGESKAQRYWRIRYPLSDVANTTRCTEQWLGYVQTTAIAPGAATENSPTDFNFTIRAAGSYTFTPESA